MDSGEPARDHGGLEVLSLADCRALLGMEEIGRVGFISSGQPVIMPVNFRMHDGHIVFRTTTGDKLDAARNAASVAFEIDSWNSGEKSGWSVIVQGLSRDVEDQDRIAELEQLGLEPWATRVERNNWVEIVPDEITGRRI